MAPGHVQSGTPRGFNLQSVPFFSSNGAIPGNFQAMQANSGFQGLVGMNQPNPWAGNGLLPGDPSTMHQPGVIRRGGGRYGGRSGPYERRGNRFGHTAQSGSGRLSPVRGMSGMFGPGGRLPTNTGAAYLPSGHPAAAGLPTGANFFPDAMGSTGAHQIMGPREAVQGRSLKSYEDLDAVGGSGSGELNY